MNERTQCTWCRGTGFIRRKFEPSKTYGLRWLLILAFLLFAISMGGGGRIFSGVSAWIFLGVLGLIFAFQFGLDIYEELKTLFGSREACPHCGRTRGTGAPSSETDSGNGSI